MADGYASGNLVEKADVTGLKTILDTARGKRSNPHTSAGKYIRDMSTGSTPSSNSVLASEVSGIFNAIKAFKASITVPSSGSSLTNLTSYYTIVNALNNDTNENLTTCNGMCVGFCSDACYATCGGENTGSSTSDSVGAESCTGDCTGACASSACTGECQSNCQSGCVSNCSTSCRGGCTACQGCGENCTGSCSGGCQQGCTGTCKGSCRTGCSGTCKGGCRTSCTGGNGSVINSIDQGLEG